MNFKNILKELITSLIFYELINLQSTIRQLPLVVRPNVHEQIQQHHVTVRLCCNELLKPRRQVLWRVPKRVKGTEVVGVTVGEDII